MNTIRNFIQYTFGCLLITLASGKEGGLYKYIYFCIVYIHIYVYV